MIDKQYADELLKAETGDLRTMRRPEKFLVGFIAISWAVFQLALAGALVLDSTMVRACHLAFAMALLFLLAPCLKHPRKYLGYLHVTDRITVLDYALAIVGALCAMYLVIDYQGIAMRAGVPLTRDLIVGALLVLLVVPLLLEVQLILEYL